MEDKALARIAKDMQKDPSVLTMDNIHMVKITEKIRDGIQKHGETITRLSLAVCRLFSLANFPELPKVRTLNLNDNRLRDEDLKALVGCKSLTRLSLCGNQIKSVDSLAVLSQNARIKMIDLENNPAATGAYRKRLFEMFPNLQLVDYQDSQGKEHESVQESDDTESEDGDDDVGDFIEDAQNSPGNAKGEEGEEGEEEDPDESGDEAEDEEEDDGHPEVDSEGPDKSDDEAESSTPDEATPALPAKDSQAPNPVSQVPGNEAGSLAIPDETSKNTQLKKRSAPCQDMEGDRPTKRVSNN